jgi:hypothetical protein
MCLSKLYMRTGSQKECVGREEKGSASEVYPNVKAADRDVEWAWDDKQLPVQHTHAHTIPASRDWHRMEEAGEGGPGAKATVRSAPGRDSSRLRDVTRKRKCIWSVCQSWKHLTSSMPYRLMQPGWMGGVAPVDVPYLPSRLSPWMCYHSLQQLNI